MPRSESRISRSSSTTRTLDILLLGCGGLSRQWKLHHKFGAGGLVFFHTDGSLMVFNNTAHNGQAQTGAAFLGGEVGKEQTLLHLAVDAMAGVSHRDLNGVFVVGQGGGDVNLP